MVHMTVRNYPILWCEGILCVLGICIPLRQVSKFQQILILCMFWLCWQICISWYGIDCVEPETYDAYLAKCVGLQSKWYACKRPHWRTILSENTFSNQVKIKIKTLKHFRLLLTSMLTRSAQKDHFIPGNKTCFHYVLKSIGSAKQFFLWIFIFYECSASCVQY